jgi:hypothetical protein
MGLLLTGGALIALARRLPPWAGPWLSTAAAAWAGILVYVMEDPRLLNNDLVELLLVVIMLAVVLLSLVLAGWQGVRSGLLAGLTLGMVFTQSILFNAAATPLQRFDVALLVLPVGLAQGTLLYLVVGSNGVSQWASAVLALLLDIAVIFWTGTLWRDWLARYGWSDDSVFSAFLSVCPVLFALTVSAVRWGWRRWRTRLTAG